MKPWHEEPFEKLVCADLETALVWAMKELWAKFLDEPDETSARHYLENRKAWVARGESGSHEKKVANAVAEGLNIKIQALKSAARDCRNLDLLPNPQNHAVGRRALLPIPRQPGVAVAVAPFSHSCYSGHSWFPAVAVSAFQPFSLSAFSSSVAPPSDDCPLTTHLPSVTTALRRCAVAGKQERCFI